MADTPDARGLALTAMVQSTVAISFMNALISRLIDDGNLPEAAIDDIRRRAIAIVLGETGNALPIELRKLVLKELGHDA